MAEASSSEKPPERKDDTDNPIAGVADMSPNKRYIRWSDIISQSGSSGQFSYKAFDTKNGIEVVWHTINLNAMEESEQSRVAECINIVKKIQHKYVIEYQSLWFVEKNRTLNIITTHLEPLDVFISKVMTLRWRIVKKWAKQILQGLDYLHGNNIVHRNLTCSHIYINGGTGHTNIGDLWMAAILSEDESPIGISASMTSAFTAPESSLTSKLDIYSFGMCMLEMITREEPYRECGGSYTAISNKALAGQLPLSLSSINHATATAFITECLKHAPDRPSAADLLAHPFLQPGQDDDEEVVVALSTTSQDLDAPATSSLSTPSGELPPRDMSSPVYEAASVSVSVVGSPVTPKRRPSHSGGGGGGGADGSFLNRSLEALGMGIISAANSCRIDECTEPAVSRSSSGHEGDAFDESCIGVGVGVGVGMGVRLTGSTPKLASPDSSNSGACGGHESSTGLEVDDLQPSAANITRKLGKELADFEQGENIDMDKGVHDGRSDQDEGEQVSPGGSTFASFSPQASSKTEQATSAVAVAVAAPVVAAADATVMNPPADESELNLQITIPTVENGQVVVEFMFNSKVENFEEVARAMIEEVKLAVSVDQLAAMIEHVVREARSGSSHSDSPATETGTITTNAVTASTEVSSHGEVESGNEGAAVAARLEATEDTVTDPSGDSKQLVGTEASTDGGGNTPHQAEATVEVPAAVPWVESVHAPSDDSPTHPPAPAVTALMDTRPETTADAAPAPAADVSSFGAPNAVPGTAVAHAAPSTACALSPESTEAAIGKGPDLAITEWAAGLVDQTEDELQAMLETLSKEERVAKRAFDHRIEKHKTIQENCKEEFQKIHLDFQLKKSDQERKEEAAQKKKEEDLMRLQTELELRKQEYFDRKRRERRAARQRALHTPEAEAQPETPAVSMHEYMASSPMQQPHALPPQPSLPVAMPVPPSSMSAVPPVPVAPIPLTRTISSTSSSGQYGRSASPPSSSVMTQAPGLPTNSSINISNSVQHHMAGQSLNHTSTFAPTSGPPVHSEGLMRTNSSDMWRSQSSSQPGFWNPNMAQTQPPSNSAPAPTATLPPQRNPLHNSFMS